MTTTTKAALVLMKPEDVAEILRCDRESVMRYIRKGLLGSCRPGGKEYRITQAHLEAFLADSETPVRSPRQPKPARNPNRRYAN